jgi:predicted nucleic acid-binding protein
MDPSRHRIFLDSNVILSGLFSGSGAPRLILDVLSLDLPVLSGLTGRYNLIEIERNIGKKMPGALPAYQRVLPRLELEIVPLPSGADLRLLSGAADQKDLPILASAINGRADHFVTGDKRLAAAIGRKGGFPFKTSGPAEFLDRIMPSILAGKGF